MEFHLEDHVEKYTYCRICLERRELEKIYIGEYFHGELMKRVIYTSRSSWENVPFWQGEKQQNLSNTPGWH